MWDKLRLIVKTIIQWVRKGVRRILISSILTERKKKEKKKKKSEIKI